jgi:hypothetical protein
MNGHCSMTPLEIASRWRASQDDETRRSGIVLIWNGMVTGWRDRLRDPQKDVPGVLAVDVKGQVFVAEGGDDYSGAKCWKPVDA